MAKHRSRLTNAGPEAQDTLLARGNGRVLKPDLAVVVGAEQAMGADVSVPGQLCQGALELLLREVEGVVVDVLGGVLEGLQEEVHLSEVSTRGHGQAVSGICEARVARGAGGRGIEMRGGGDVADPLPSSMTMAPSGMLLTISVAKDLSTSISSLVK